MNDAPRTMRQERCPITLMKTNPTSGYQAGAIDENGNLVFGPFDTYDQCVERDIGSTYLMLAPSLEHEKPKRRYSGC
jgi:hypothetical protein